MAKYYDGYMGAFSGKLGTAIGYMWKGRPCLRSLQANPRNRRTKAQQQGRKVFGIASALAANMIDATEIGFRGLAEARRMSGSNIFMSLNRHCINVEDDMVNVDYSALWVSDGELPGVAFGEIQSAGSQDISVEYGIVEGDGGCYDDYVYLYAYVPLLEDSLLSMPAARCDNRVSLVAPSRWTGREVHLYGFVWDHDHEASPSKYLGNILLN